MKIRKPHSIYKKILLDNLLIVLFACLAYLFFYLDYPFAGSAVFLFLILLSFFLAKGTARPMRSLQEIMRSFRSDGKNGSLPELPYKELEGIYSVFEEMKKEYNTTETQLGEGAEDGDKKANSETGELKKVLSRMEEDKKNLENQRLATLNILEDVNQSGEELKATNKALSEKKQELEILRSLGMVLSSVLESDEAINVFSTHLARVVDFNTAVFVIVDYEEIGKISYSAFLNQEVSEQYLNSLISDMVEFFSAERSGLMSMSHLIKNIKPRIFGKRLDNARKETVQRRAIYPIMAGEKTLLVIQLSSEKKDNLSLEKRELIEAMISNLSIAISRLYTIERSQNTKTGSLIESLRDGIVMFDYEKKIILVNPSASAYLGIAKNQDFGLKDVCARFVDQDLLEKVQSSLKSGEAYTLDNVVYGEYFFELFVIPVKDVNAKIVGGAIILRDVTSLKKIDRMKTEFVSVASHQLRTPLTAIKLFTGMLIKGDVGLLNEQQGEYLNNIYESTERMVRLVNDLLNVTRIESGRLRTTPEPTILKNFINSVIAEAKPLAENKNIKIDFTYDDDTTLIPLDQNLMRQVVHNLLINAIRYSRSGSGLVSVAIKRKNPEVFLISVADNGIGIPKEMQKRIFEKFFRADNAIKAVTEGTGLGLYVSKMIVESSGGKVWFESFEGQGTTFFVEVPVKGMEKKEGDRGLSIS